MQSTKFFQKKKKEKIRKNLSKILEINLSPREPTGTVHSFAKTKIKMTK